MSNLVTPKIEREAESRNYGKFVIKPLEKGFGLTLGNALRRVLLSSLQGAAVTSLRIVDIPHEFTDIEGIREDVIRIMLQIKQLRMILHDTDSARLQLEIGSEGVVTAADIIAPPEVEIVNPDLYLFTVDSRISPIEMEFSVERGRGYSPAEERSGHLPIGELPVDAIFNPVVRVNWDVGTARVGQSTDFDRLEIEIWTDGTIGPENALSVASKVIIDHLMHLAGITEESLTFITEEEEEVSKLSSDMIETPIENLDLSVRVFNSLKRTGITSIGEIIDLLDKGDDALMSIRNFGEKSLNELRGKMTEKGYLENEDQETEEVE